MRRNHALALASLAALAACATEPPKPAAPPAQVQGYLAKDALNMVKVLMQPPKAGGPRDEADRATYRTTRALEGSDRWKLAINDADETRPAVMRDFSCAVGAQLTPQTAPKLDHLLARMRVDIVAAGDGPKNTFARPRPFTRDPGNICFGTFTEADKTRDYPSGHTTWGWALALVFAELAPDRATPVLIRGRAFGESRVVCGVHNISATDAGRTNGASVVAALHGQAAFRSDLDGVRAELAALRKSGPAPTGCEAEAALTATSPF